MRNHLCRVVQVTCALVVAAIISNIYVDLYPRVINVPSKSRRLSINHDDFRTESNHITDFRKSEKCLINVHGLHHTGTGFLRSLIHESLKGLSSMHEDTHKSEDEGQHLQHVYPTFADRAGNPSLCGVNKGSTKSYGRLYYCPEMVENGVKDTDKTDLFDQWSKYWDLSKPYLIQKTPTLDILLLEKLKTSQTFHSIVIKHPFRWHVPGISRDVIPFVWLDVWTNTFELLASNKIKSFAVINYEMLINEESPAMHEISNMVKDECFSGAKMALQYHKGEEISTYNKLSDPELNVWKACEKKNECSNLMNDLKPIINEIGYSWDTDNFFLSSNVKKDGSRVLFSSSHRPSEGLVSKMKAVVNKYNT